MIDMVHWLKSEAYIQDSLSQGMKKEQSGVALLKIFDEGEHALTPLFQPIVSLRSHSVFGYEGLIRGKPGSLLEMPDVLFEVAKNYKLTTYLDSLCRAIVVNQYEKQQGHQYLFLNSSPQIFSKQRHFQFFVKLLEHHHLSPDNVVIEITEQAEITKPKKILQEIEKYRDLGVMIALDDLGAGYNGLKLWSQLKPEFVKIDKHFVMGASKDAEKHHFLETITALANSLNSQVIAEGVENEEDLNVLTKLGVPLAQGYLFSKPRKEINMPLQYQWPRKEKPLSSQEGKVSYLSRPISSLPPEMKISDVVDLFHKDETQDFFPVVKEGRVLGMIWRKDLMNKLASRFGRELHAKKPIRSAIDQNPIIVDYGVAVEDLSRTITESQFLHKRDAFIITRDNVYYGCGGLYDLLRYITDLKIQNALYANPLSGLPGNVPIQKVMQSWLNANKEFCMHYIDLDHFKAFNDYYSFEQGDNILKSLSALLQRHVSAEDDFLGHIGGDDFVLLSPNITDSARVAQGIINEFGDMIRAFYKPDDVGQGGILGIDRNGQKKIFSIMSMSIGIVLVRPGHITHQQQLSSVATRAKKKAKKSEGDCFVIFDTKDMEMGRVSVYANKQDGVLQMKDVQEFNLH